MTTFKIRRGHPRHVRRMTKSAYFILSGTHRGQFQTKTVNRNCCGNTHVVLVRLWDTLGLGRDCLSRSRCRISGDVYTCRCGRDSDRQSICLKTFRGPPLNSDQWGHEGYVWSNLWAMIRFTGQATVDKAEQFHQEATLGCTAEMQPLARLLQPETRPAVIRQHVKGCQGTVANEQWAAPTNDLGAQQPTLWSDLDRPDQAIAARLATTNTFEDNLLLVTLWRQFPA